MGSGPTEVDRVFVLGDIHGNVDFLRRAATTAAEAGCRTILQLGDFGALWPGSRGFFRRVDELLHYGGIDKLVFIDGNHEGFTSDDVSCYGPGDSSLTGAWLVPSQQPNETSTGSAFCPSTWPGHHGATAGPGTGSASARSAGRSRSTGDGGSQGGTGGPITRCRRTSRSSASVMSHSTSSSAMKSRSACRWSGSARSR